MDREELNKKAVEKIETALEAYEQEPFEDFISREKAIEDVVKCTDMNDDTMDVLIEKLQALPPVQPVGRKGRWILSGGKYRCSECGEKAKYIFDKSKGGYNEYEQFRSDFCPNCGADMRNSNQTENVIDGFKAFTDYVWGK